MRSVGRSDARAYCMAGSIAKRTGRRALCAVPFPTQGCHHMKLFHVTAYTITGCTLRAVLNARSAAHARALVLSADPQHMVARVAIDAL